MEAQRKRAWLERMQMLCRMEPSTLLPPLFFYPLQQNIFIKITDQGCDSEYVFLIRSDWGMCCSRHLANREL